MQFMKKITLLLIFSGIVGIINLFSQCSNCNSNYPSALQTITPGQTLTVSTLIYGGEYSYYSVIAGVTYTWSTCGSTGFDTYLTLFQGGTCGSGTVLSYNDDACGLQSTIIWTATFTGTVTLLVSEYGCATNTTPMTLTWSAKGDSKGGNKSGGGDCTNADPFCTGTTYTFPMNTGTTAESGPNYACLCMVPDPVWYYLLIDNSGPISIGISSPSNDVDFVCWGPFTSPTAQCTAGLTANCSGCVSGTCPNNTTSPSFYPSGVTVDCSYDAAHSETCHISNALHGQYYLLCITNFSDVPGNLTFTQTGGTGTTNCNIVTCSMTNLTATPSACNPSTNTYSVSGTITFTGQPTTGQLIVTDNSGASQTFNAPFTSPITYTLSNITANGTTHTITAYFSDAPTCALTISYTAPAACNTCTANAGTDQTVCGLSATLAAVLGSGYPTHSWSPQAGLSFSDVTSATSTVTASTPGTYTLTWNVTNSSGVSCSDQVIITFVQPIAGFTYNGNQCLSGNSFTFTNTGTSSGATYSWSFPSGTPSASTAQNPGGITWSTAGAYTVTQVVTVGTCTATYTQTITVYANPTASISPTNAKCFGACNGSAVASGSGGSGTYSYSWNTGATTQNISSLCPNSYTVTVTDTYGCKGTASVNITQPAALSLNATRTNPTCNGFCNGTANVAVSGGIGPFSYLWSNSGNSATINGLCSGTYTVTVTDQASSGCTQTANVVLTDPPAMVLSTSKVDATCGINNGSATVTITSGGTPNYSYAWSNGSTTNNTAATSNTITNVSAGSYIVTVTDVNGCSKTTTVNVASSGAPTATITANTNPLCNGQCNGTATVSLTVTTTSPYNYIWSNGSQTLGTASTSNSVNNLCAGTTSITVTDNLGCSAVTTVNLTAPTALAQSTTSVSAHCGHNDGSATINVSGGTPGYTYLWNAVAGNQTTQTATNLVPGSYTVTATDVHGCTIVGNVTVGNVAGVVASIASQTNVSCNGGNNGSATASGSGGNLPYTYLWPASAGNQTTATAINLAAGSYVVTVTDANGCTSTASVTITQPSVVTATASVVSNALCNGACNGSANVVGGGGTSPYTYAWSNTQTSATATGLCAGTYNVTVRDANNCSAITSVTVTQPTALSASASSVSAHCNQSDGSASASASGGTPPFSYVWSSGQHTQNITNVTSGTYTVTVTDANGCTAVANTVVGNFAGGTATIATLIYASCNGVCDGSTSVSMAGGTTPYTYLWSNGATSSSVSGLCEAMYTVTVTDAAGCTATAMADVKAPSPLTLTFVINDINCSGQCTGQISVTPSGGTPSYTYAWSNSVTLPANSNLCSGNYMVTVNDSHGCSVTGSRTISTIPPMVLSAVNTDANCNQSNGALDLTVTNGAAPFTYHWSGGQNTQDLSNIPAGVYNVTVSDIKGCTVTGSYTVSNISGPSASISSFTNVTCNGMCNGIAVGQVVGGTSPFLYTWSNGQNAQTVTGLCPGTYTFSVTDGAGCVSTANVTITQPTAMHILTISSTNPSCNSDCNGTVSVNVGGGTTPYTYQWTGGSPFGGSTPNAATTGGICSGMLTVTVTDANNCTISGSTGVVEPAILSLIPSSTPETCSGASNGSASVLPAGGTTPYTYQWSANTGGQTSATAHNLGVGSYSCTVTDAHGCTVSIPVNVAGPNPLIFSNITSTDIPCYLANNGTISVNVSGGTSPYSYSWTNSIGTYSSTSQNIGNLPAETYFLTVTDANGCFITTNVVINQPPALQLNTIKTDETCYQFCNGTIQANVNGGQVPYTYLWTNSQTTSSLQNLCPGNYSVTITDHNGCTVSSSTTISGPPLLQIDVVDVIPATCGQSNGEATISFQGGTTGYTIQWSTGGNSVHETGMPAGNHTVTLIDQNGCIDTLQVSIQNLNGPSITSVISSPVSCAGLADGVAIVSYTSSNPPAPPYVTTWSNSMSGDTITGLAGGIYYVTVQDAIGCVSAGSVIVQEPTPFVSVVSSTTNNHCNGECIGTASVLAGGGTPPYTYSWLGIGQTNSNATNLCAGTYSVVAVDVRGCSSVNTVVITEPPTINITGNVTDVLCNSGNTGAISVTVSGGTPVYQYIWQPPAFGTTSDVANLSSGTYSVIVTDSWNCTNQASFTINQPNPILVYTSTTPSHCGNDNGTATIDSVTGGVSAYSYLWSPGNMNTSTITDLASGIYQLIVTDANSCTIVTPVPVSEIYPPSLISFTHTNTLCYGSFNGTATATVAGGLAPYSFEWSNGQTNATAINLGAGTYSVTVTDNNGCTIANSTVISEPNPIIVFANGSDTICMGNYSVNITANAAGGIPPYSFVWTGPDLINPNSQVQLVSPDTTTNYFVNVYDANGCASIIPGSIMVFVYSPITATVSSDAVICQGDVYSINVTAQGGKPPYSYIWNIGTGNPNVVSPVNTTTYTVQVYDACGTPPAIDSMTIFVQDPPHIIREPRSQKGCVPLLADFDCVVDPASLPVTYLWNFGDPSSGLLNISNDSMTSHLYGIPGNYNVMLTLTSSFGCQTTQTYNNLVQVFPFPVVDFTYSPTENLTPINGDVSFSAQTEANYQLIWHFGDGSNAAGVLNPMHTYTQPGVYAVLLIASNSEGCADTALHYVKINETYTLWVPTAFTPGSGKGNGYFYPRGLGIDSSDYYFAIFDRWGQLIFETRIFPRGTIVTPSEVISLSVSQLNWEPGGWNGGYNNDLSRLVPVGTYTWYVRVKEKDTGYVHEKSGPVTVIR
jgi:PKD repeat protein